MDRIQFTQNRLRSFGKVFMFDGNRRNCTLWELIFCLFCYSWTSTRLARMALKEFVSLRNKLSSDRKASFPFSGRARIGRARKGVRVFFLSPSLPSPYIHFLRSPYSRAARKQETTPSLAGNACYTGYKMGAWFSYVVGKKCYWCLTLEHCLILLYCLFFLSCTKPQVS